MQHISALCQLTEAKLRSWAGELCCGEGDAEGLRWNGWCSAAERLLLLLLLLPAAAAGS